MADVPTKYRIHLHDEIPKFGCGIIFVTVEKVGRKWVHLTKDHTSKSARVSKKLWIHLLGVNIHLNNVTP